MAGEHGQKARSIVCLAASATFIASGSASSSRICSNSKANSMQKGTCGNRSRSVIECRRYPASGRSDGVTRPRLS